MASIQEQLEAIAKALPEALPADRMAAVKEIARIHRQINKGTATAKINARCQRLHQLVSGSVAVLQRRRQHSIQLAFDTELPIYAHKAELIEAITQHQVLIVAGQTGSGKTTQLPKFCLAAGRGVEGYIGMTQPRRIAATSVSRRIAQELNEAPGLTVGYKIRFQDTVSPQTRIKLMTDGILLAEAHKDPGLLQYDTLIVDEAHERSLNIDFILGLLKKLLQKRPDVKVIITSATIDTQKFSQAFNQAPVVEVSGRMYPVRTHYADEANDELTHVEKALQAVDHLIHKGLQGDILIFMPTEQDIRDMCDSLRGRHLKATQVIPLFARLSAAEQQKVFHSGSHRKIIVATNVAETSITIPGIRIVIDTGLARISRYTPRSRTTTLPISPISKSSADQRQGRCGRVANGICYRLYTQEDYEDRPLYTAPEILRANLADVILRMIALELGDVEAFPFIDPPAPKSVQDGYQLLLELGAIGMAPPSRSKFGKYQLTPKGRLMSRLPLDPRLSCMLLEAHDRGCLDDMAIIAAALSIQDPRERPAIRQAEADQAQAVFITPTSDFLTLLRVWHTYQKWVKKRSSWGQVKRRCFDHFLSFRRMREWQDIYRQILRVLAEHRIRPQKPSRFPDDQTCEVENSGYAAVHQSIISGFLSNLAHQKEGQIFQATYNRQVMIFPGSGLFKNPGQWIVAAEIVETSRLFARCAAMIDPAWIEAMGKDQCKYTYLDPHWERKRQQVVAIKQVSLFGLIIDKRKCAYGPVDPAEAGRIFIQHALIEGDVSRPKGFMQHNRRLVEEVQDMEDRLRRKDLLIAPQDLLSFYEEKLGNVYDWPSLNKRIKQRGGDRFLRLSQKDLMRYEPEGQALAQYPNRVTLGRQSIRCRYHFAPGEAHDGITADVPAQVAGTLCGHGLGWLVPGLLAEKINALIKALPKQWRKQLVPIAGTAATIAAEMPVEKETPLAGALSRFIAKRFGVKIPADAWNETALPDHLRMRIAITDPKGNILTSGRDPAILGGQETSNGISQEFKLALKNWEQSNVTDWNFGDLDDSIELAGAGEQRWTVYPALEERNGTVVLTAFADPRQAGVIHRQGVKALLMRRFAADLKFLQKNLQLSAAFNTVSRYFDGLEVLNNRLVARVVDDLMAKDIRHAEIFHATAAQLERDGIARQGQSLRQCVMDVITAYANLRAQFLKREKAHTNQASAKKYLEELRAHLNQLVPKNFIQLYDQARMQRLLRYMQAISLRAQRGLVDLEKDHAKASTIAPFQTRLNELVGSLSPQTSAPKRQAIETFLWMLEEFKISVFAQEIKTAHPISAKRLEKQLEKIDAMV